MSAPWRRDFDTARDPYAARNALGITSTALGAQPLDADLTAIAALTGTNTIYYRSAANTWTPVTIGSNMTFSGGTLDAVAAGGGAWTTWAPTISATSGTITSTTVSKARYTQHGKTVTLVLDLTITNAGTGSGSLLFTLPVTMSALAVSVIYGRETVVSGAAISGTSSGTTQGAIVYYAAGSVIATSARVIAMMIYEAA